MSILVDGSTRVVVQGITGQTGRLMAQRMRSGCTRLVGGVTPGRGGTIVCGVPVFESVQEARTETGANAVVCCVSHAGSVEALIEAIDAGVNLAVLYAEDLPVHDAIWLCEYARLHGTRLLGPNSAGVVSPGLANLSDLNDRYLRPGTVGIVSRSGTLTYEVVSDLAGFGFGVSTVVCLGGDRVLGTSYEEVLRLFEDDDGTDAIVLLGEPGGRGEVMAAELIAAMQTPVVACIVGKHAPSDTRMGHAGAVLGEEAASSPEAKVEAMITAGAAIAPLVTQVGATVGRLLGYEGFE